MRPNNTRNVLVVGTIVLLVGAVGVYRQWARPAGLPPPQGAPTTRAAMLPRVLDLGSDKCVACREMAPILAELKREYDGRAVVDFIDVWKNPGAAEPFGARVIPTQVFFDRTGREVWRHEGFLSKTEIVAKLKELGAG